LGDCRTAFETLVYASESMGEEVKKRVAEAI
jgi:hypothetical protein